eukprot:6180799-Pleurochrysis_carterae.AAC.5
MGPRRAEDMGPVLNGHGMWKFPSCLPPRFVNLDMVSAPRTGLGSVRVVHSNARVRSRMRGIGSSCSVKRS